MLIKANEATDRDHNHGPARGIDRSMAWAEVGNSQSQKPQPAQRKRKELDVFIPVTDEN